MKTEYDVIVIGSGPAGMAAAVSASDAGASVCLVEREEKMGGILKQCIHDGFGLIRFEEKLSGPEYAWRYEQMVDSRDIDFLNLTFLTGLEPPSPPGSMEGSAIPEKGRWFRLNFISSVRGVFSLKAASIVTAMGCRERTDRQIFLHGSRPAGIFTAGQAQDFINLKGLMPGRRPVILGSGDIGLIMARRFTLEGAKVSGVYEIGPRPSGLTRNVVQCLEDFDIPLYLNSTVTEVHGKDRIEAVTVCRLGGLGQPDPETAELVECDSLILSVGLIPENDILTPLEIEMDPVTRGPAVDQNMQTSISGIYSCGNALHVSDLVDYVSESGYKAGFAAACSVHTKYQMETELIPIESRGNLQYIMPQRLSLRSSEVLSEKAVPVFFRPLIPADEALLVISSGEQEIYRRKLRYLKPSEMQRVEVDFFNSDRINEPVIVELKTPAAGTGNE
ncbi:MAG: NAD(P)/FAD-dependent oxidoreductase [Spirochaetales bacterium]|uniref:NAD(P)/FAD-dependent oxidoreductase n=1 Tax=Candidatus Thalassospirochaeta sargassi TaxID=3119039 RepID=A0AAJ1IF12_9SPIO|nr:NAD(P)/FAD-dependent oxidoreductase [Spirochaetales bacterium]